MKSAILDLLDTPEAKKFRNLAKFFYNDDVAISILYNIKR